MRCAVLAFFGSLLGGGLGGGFRCCLRLWLCARRCRFGYGLGRFRRLRHVLCCGLCSGGIPLGVRLRAMGMLDIAHQFVRFILRHLSATHHVLYELTRAFHCKGREARSRIDDVFHRSRHLASCFQADLVRACRHLGDCITDVLPTVSRSASRRRCYRGTGDYRGGGRSFRGVGWNRRRTSWRGVSHRNGYGRRGATGAKLRRVFRCVCHTVLRKSGWQSALSI